MRLLGKYLEVLGLWNDFTPNLQAYAQELLLHGSDVLKGDLSVFEDLAIINKNQGEQFLK
jgi:hypothetical protein